MKPIAWAGVALVVLGALALVFQGFTYDTKKNVVDLGTFHVTASEQRRIDIPPVIGGLIVLGGIVLIVAGSRQKA